jgi:hypothetical protein
MRPALLRYATSMKRRRVLQSLAGIPGATALPWAALADNTVPRAIVETPKTPVSTADSVAHGMPRFLSHEEFSALERLAELLAPAQAGVPGAREAGAAAFLDFLLGQSPGERSTLYREGLAKLNRASRQRFEKPFAELTPEQADPLLAPLRAAWTYHGPEDPFARFLAAAKEDVLTTTLNSREWAAAMSRRTRSAGGLGSYWYPVED